MIFKKKNELLLYVFFTFFDCFIVKMKADPDVVKHSYSSKLEATVGRNTMDLRKATG